ncbi:transcription termination factor NusA [Patescibacteria group bacterium]|nr:transcription termination factor NusA [Patescibacteria group bacterium]
MPAQVRSEFALALNQVASERNISVETILANIEEAMLMAYRKDRAMYGEVVEVEQFVASVDSNTGEARIYRKKEDGSRGEDVTPPGFGRIAAQTAGQVLRQKIREAEKKAVIEDFSQRIGTAVSGMVLRFDGPNIIIDIGRAEAVMPPAEQNPAEHYRLNQRLIFYIKEIRESARGQEVVVSRASENLVVELFRKEVPEFQSGAVIIKLIAREAGGRTKLAVASTQSGVDPVGASVGQKGVRVQAVINELGGNEKVDVIQYTEDTAALIAAALAPAKDIEVILNQEEKTAIALVPDDQLSLAIGREGQNVRLAAKLLGEWKIDIKGKAEYAKKDEVKAEGTKDEEKREEKKAEVEQSAKSENQNAAE